MRNAYKIIDYRKLNLPIIEVYGDRFHYQDLYVLVGKDQFITTFYLKKKSLSYKNYGDYVLGVIYYDAKSINALEASFSTGNEVATTRIRVDCPSRNISMNEKGDLKYRGVNVEDIECISFFSYKRETEVYDTGEKKVPDIVKVKVDFSGMDVDILNQYYLVSKNNSGTKLVQYEKEQLIGITLALNNRKIDSRILNYMGFKEDDLNNNLNIWMSLYKVLERRNQLTEFDKLNYTEIKNILTLERMSMSVKELGNAGLSKSMKDTDIEVLKKIFKAVDNFSPSILMHGKNQVYWDLSSYIHITFRHLKDYQLGGYRNKTPFPYKADDLKSLIEKVLNRVKGEIEQYLSNETTNDFTRNGKMAIFYNGDHYHLRIDQTGKLIQFHSVGSSFNKTTSVDVKSCSADLQK